MHASGDQRSSSLVKIAQCACRTMATLCDDSVKESETEKAGQGGGPGDGGIIRVEEVQATVEALVQKVLESARTQHKAPLGDDGEPQIPG